MPKRPTSVQLMLDRLKADAQYKDGIPKSWMGGPMDSGEAETALLAYVEELEKRPLKKKTTKPKT